MPPQDDTIKQIARYYLFHGPNAYKLDERVSSLIKAALARGAEAFDLDRFEGKGCDVPTVINAVSTPPALSPLRVVVLFNAEKIAPSGQNMLESFLPKIPVYSVLAMTAVKADKRSKLFKTLLADEKLAKHYDEYTQQDAAGMAVKFAADRGKKISAEVADVVVDCFGTDPYRLGNEIEKLSLYVGDKKEIEKKDLAFASGLTKAESLSDLPDLIFRGKSKDALELTRRALASGTTEMQMLYTLKNYLMGLSIAHSLSSPNRLMPVIHVSYERARELYGRSRTVSQEVVVKGLSYIFRAEYSLKSARFPSDGVIELLVSALCLVAAGNNQAVNL